MLDSTTFKRAGVALGAVMALGMATLAQAQGGPQTDQRIPNVTMPATCLLYTSPSPRDS